MSAAAAFPRLDARLLEAFAGAYLSPMYDNPQPTPPFHRRGWELYCSDALLVSLVAPREHAKSTGFTHDYACAVLAFRAESYIVIVSATEDLAKDHLADIARVFRENDEVRRDFLIESMPVDAKTEIVVKCSDGHEFRVLAKGSGQKMRGLKWKGRRPGLIIGDDLEDDEQVENKDRRRKFSRWFNRALLPALRRGGKARIHGTILHEDSLLARIQKPQAEEKKVWETLFFRAHDSFDEFTGILWPEQFPPERLRAIRQRFINEGDAPGYSQEYLNDPLDNEDRYLHEPWFLPMDQPDRDRSKMFFAAADFAISKRDSANRTSLTVGGLCSRNLLHFVDQHVGRFDSFEIVEEMFSIQERWSPDIFFVEDGQIWKALRPIIMREQLRSGRYINFVERSPITDKASRGRSLQRRMRGSATRWDHEAHWFEPMREEMMRFTGHAEATLDDQFDSAALLSLGLEEMSILAEDDFETDEEHDFRRQDPRVDSGRNPVTGY